MCMNEAEVESGVGWKVMDEPSMASVPGESLGIV